MTAGNSNSEFRFKHLSTTTHSGIFHSQRVVTELRGNSPWDIPYFRKELFCEILFEVFDRFFQGIKSLFGFELII